MVSAISTAGAAGVTTATSSARTSSGADFDTFLKMLTTQLKNQDPLNPMEGNEFAVQLATFSGVERQAQANVLLQQLVNQTGTGDLSQAAEMIGQEARTTAAVWFGDTPLTLEIEPDPAATGVTLIALDAEGNEITREEIGPGEGQIAWYGRDLAGQKLPEGRYSFLIESTIDGEVIEASEVGAYARIVGAQLDDGGVRLVFEGGSTAMASEITALRDPT